MIIHYLLIGSLIGVILGLTGSGGGIFAIPLLIFFTHASIQEASPIALFAVSIGAGVGTLTGLKENTVRYRAALLIALAAFPTSFLGIKAATILPHNTLIVIFSFIMCWVAWTQLKKPPSKELAETLIQINPDTQRFIWNIKTGVVFASLGLGIGFLTGLLGVGGGFIIVPSLRKLTSISMRSATATSLMIITLVSGQTILGHLSQGKNLPWIETTVFTLMTVAGLTAARKYGKSIPERGLQIIFAIMLLAIALLMTWPVVVSAARIH